MHPVALYTELWFKLSWENETIGGRKRKMVRKRKACYSNIWFKILRHMTEIFIIGIYLLIYQSIVNLCNVRWNLFFSLWKCRFENVAKIFRVYIGKSIWRYEVDNRIIQSVWSDRKLRIALLLLNRTSYSFDRYSNGDIYTIFTPVSDKSI